MIDDAVNETIYQEIKGWTVGAFREWLLADGTTPEKIRRVSNALTGEMAAAVTKLMSNLDLIYAAKKIRVLSDHPKESYQLSETSPTSCTLTITDATAFWKGSRYLVVMTPD